MGIVVVPTFGADPVTVTGPTLDAKVSGLATEFNGSIDNDNIKASAGILASKLSLATITDNIAHSGTMTHTGTVTITGKDLTEAKCADIASATTTTVWATDGNYAHITGTTTITSFGTAGQAGDCRTIVFDGILTLTHNATSLILPTGANITTAAGDTAIVRAETTANARVIAYLRKDGTATAGAFTPSVTNALSGSVIQTVSTETGAFSSGTTTIPLDDTIPQITEGDQYMTLAVTPNNASNTLIIDVVLVGNQAGSETIVTALFQDATASALASTAMVSANALVTCRLTHIMTAGTTSSTTFRVRAGGQSGGINFNGRGAARLLGGVMASSITIREIKA